MQPKEIEKVIEEYTIAIETYNLAIEQYPLLEVPVRAAFAEAALESLKILRDALTEVHPDLGVVASDALARIYGAAHAE